MGGDNKIALETLLLTSCRSPFLDDEKIYAPMANLYLKSFVEENTGTKVTLGSDNYDLDRPESFSGYDAVGISIMTPQRREAEAIAAAIKRHSPNTEVIAGGPHVKHYTSEVLRNPLFDYVVVGDGEKSLVDIARGSTERLHMSMLTKQEIKDAPRPDRTSPDAVAMIQEYNYMLGERNATTMMTGRGCPEMCTFCEDAQTSIRWSGIDNLRGEMDDIKAMGFDGVYIFDDLFAISRKMIRPIVEELSTRDLAFRCNAQARYFTRDGDAMARLLSANGCQEIAFGAESGSQKILDNIMKRCTVEQNYETVRIAKKHGLKVKAFMLLGLPGEDRETLQETETFIANSGIDDFQCAIYMPFKGTQIRQAIDGGEEIDMQMTVEEESGAYGVRGGNTVSEVRTAELSSEELQEFRNYLVERYKPGSHGKFFEEAEVPSSQR